MKPLSFRIKVVFGITLIVSFFLSILILNSLSILKASHQKEFDQRANTLSALFTAATKDAVLSSDIATLKTLIDELITSPEVISVKVFDKVGLLSEGARVSAPDLIAKQRSQLIAYSKTTNIEVDGVSYGRVELVLDNSSVYLAYQEAKNQSIRIAIIAVLLVGLISYALGIYLTRHFVKLRQAISDIKKGQYTGQYKVDSNDEIGQTLSTLNEMALKIKQGKGETLESYKQTQELANKLSRREQWLKAVIDNIVDGVVTLDADGCIQSINRSAQEMFGYGDHELKGLNFDIFIIEEDLKQEIAQFIKKASLDTKKHQMTPLLNKIAHRRDGTPFPIQLSLSYTRRFEDSIIILLVRDISHQRTIEEQAHFSQLLKASMLETSLSAIVSIDKHDRIIEFNPVAEEIFGYSRKEALNSTLAELILPHRFREAHLMGMKHYIKTGEGPVLGKRIELCGMRKNGEEFPVEIAISAAEMGEDLYFTAVMDDISDRIESERVLKEAKEAAEYANIAKSQFLASMSHEIRTPLNIILGMVNLLKDTELAARQAEFLDAAGQAGNHLLEIVNDVLDLSKIEAGKMEAQEAETDVIEIIEESVFLFTHRAHEKALSIHYWIENAVPRSIVTDPTYLRRIISNLLSNAIKYTRRGGITVSATMAQHEGIDQLVIDVHDSGLGVDPEAQQKLFKEFSQVHQSNEEVGGTGLGLTISRQLARLMNGDVTFTPHRGGSIFSVKLNLDRYIKPDNNISMPHVRCALLSHSDRWQGATHQQLDTWGITCFESKTISELTHLAYNPNTQIKTVFIDTHTIECDENLITFSHYCAENNITIGLTGWHASDLDRFKRVESPYHYIEPAPLSELQEWVFATINNQQYFNSKLQQLDGQHNQSAATEQGSVKEVKFKALLVDDSDTNRIIARDYLESAGASVVEADNGKVAIEKLKQQPFNVILMDVRMPVLDGVKATEIIRRTHIADGTPIIALTAHAMSSERDRCLLAGMDDFLTKPVNKEIFIKTVTFWAERDRHEKLVVDNTPQLSDEKVDEHFQDVHQQDLHQQDLHQQDLHQQDLQHQNLQHQEQGSNDLSEDEAAPLIDHNALSQLIEDTSETALIKMLKLYDKETNNRITEINQFIQDDNVEMLETYAHALKSSSQTFGGWQLHLLAKEIETLCREKQYQEAYALAPQLPELSRQTLDALKETYQYDTL
ncbi:PAS domain S-box protein [Alkalimarinus sediminis]|uniref:histidine kinase n=1 Tax=Alkalimarinus sediminis TaxID=1632866 RepID=A0A9E8KQ32_9ALTE|nr:PAS domain S-box protein [Alkalimarinus sediminis]UZW75968.1 PAS domain S-box protein [Alkalimarinus sediminis]